MFNLTNPHSSASRWLALTVATWSALLAMFSDGSVAARAAGDSDIALALNWALIALAAIGWSDVFWSDIMGRNMLRGVDELLRHVLCVSLYASIAGLFGVRAFAVAALPTVDRVLITGYYLATAIGVALVAIAIATEDRRPCQSPSA